MFLLFSKTYIYEILFHSKKIVKVGSVALVLFKIPYMQVTNETTVYKTICKCNHLTWFGGGILVEPNRLEIIKEVMKLKNIQDYPGLLATVCVICGCYLIAVIWARRQDKKDMLKVNSLAMAKTHPCIRSIPKCISSHLISSPHDYIGQRSPCKLTGKSNLFFN